MGPLTEEMKAEMVELQGDIRFDIEWTTLGEYLEYLEARGVSPNVASFVGAATPRVNVLGFATVLGLGGLALSLAAQDTIANMISGLVIMVDNPFRLGDRIEVPELGTWGDDGHSQSSPRDQGGR